jgi:hypothetical protein
LPYLGMTPYTSMQRADEAQPVHGIQVDFIAQRSVAAQLLGL